MKKLLWHAFFPYRYYIKTAKNGGFCEEFLRENDFEAVLVNFCFYEYGTNAEAVEKISTAGVMSTHTKTAK